MSLLTRLTMSRAVRIGAAATAGLLLSAVAAAPARAHDAPKTGSACAMSGMTSINHGKVYACVSKAPGAKPRWGAGLPISASRLTMSDGWAKAAPSGMTAAFGMLHNPTGRAITVIAAFSPLSNVLQLHHVVQEDGAMVMQQKAGGFVIPAGGMTELVPGGNHVMFMKLKKPVMAGDMVPITFVTSDGGLFRTKVMAKVFAGGNETYQPGM